MDHSRRGCRARRLSKALPEHHAFSPQSVAGALLVLLVSAGPARAQIYESVGIRAQGMGGAFVAVADDATATWWNPAGLASGAYFNTILEYAGSQDPRQESRQDSRQPSDTSGAVPAWRSATRGFAVAFPALGLSYYHLRVSEIRPFGSIAGSGLSREDQGRAPVLLNSFVLQQFGATVGQSLGNHVVLGSTLKLVRGALASDGSDGADASLDRAAELTGKTRTHGDLDLGAMAVFGAVRFGMAVKNVTQPTFQSDTGAITLQRQVRLGVAAMSPAGRTAGPVTIAVDADLTRTPTATGDARHVAAGLDLGLFRRMLSVRGGVAANTVGGARPTGSGGVSLALRSGLFLDAQATAGNDQARRSWGIALRVTY